MSKRVFMAAFLGLVLALILAACGGGAAPTATPIAPTPGQPLAFVVLGAGGSLAEEVLGVDLSTSTYTFLATGF